MDPRRNKKFECSTCGKIIIGEEQWQQHLHGRAHKRRLEGQKRKLATEKYFNEKRRLATAKCCDEEGSLETAKCCDEEGSFGTAKCCDEGGSFGTAKCCNEKQKPENS